MSGLALRGLSEADVQNIVSLSAAEFGAEPRLRASIGAEVHSWAVRKSPTVVARVDGAFAGFARCKPNETPFHPRPEGQIAVLVQVAVLPELRGRGVGRALVTRAVQTLRMLGYAQVFAQFQPHLAGWYESLGWAVLPINHSIAWIEPHIERDDGWYPDLRPGDFSPVLRMEHLPRYPQLGYLKLSDERPIVLVEYDGGAGGRQAAHHSERALGDALAADAAALARVPSGLLEALLASPFVSPNLLAVARGT